MKSSTDLHAATTRARDRARTVGVVAEAADKQSTLVAIGRALHFPGYVAANLDALEESVRDLSWLPVGPVELVWADGLLRDADPPTHRTIREILERATGVEGEHPFRVTCVG